MTADSPLDESRLAIRSQRKFWTRRFGWSFGPAACVAVAGVILLLYSGNALLPFESTVTLEGKMDSKAAFFEDEQVQRLLLRHHIRVHVTRTGSREVATHDIESYDFVFPSGQPAANIIIHQRSAKGQYYQTRRLFSTPVVLATYREYAETLVRNGVAGPQDPRQAQPLYYTLDTARFLDLARRGVTWNEIGIDKRQDGQDTPVTNGNRVLAHSSDVCASNSGGTYIALAAFVINDGRPPAEAEAAAIAQRIKPLITAQGMPERELFPSYVSAEGKGTGPIVVVYEHQYLAYQLAFQKRNGKPDTERVLLYPKQELQTDPELIALNPKGDRLGQLLDSDPALRARALELGFRVLDPTGATGSDQLLRFLAARHIPPPRRGSDYTTAVLPELGALEKMIVTVGDCPR